jgi:hypothetical protein
MKSRVWLLSLFAAVAMTAVAQETKKVFIYSPNERAGLHIAQLLDNGWQEIGQLCSSDYGTWGVEKKMIHPSVTRAKDGTWRLVFQVNDRSPLFAASYSRDLVTWRPQDYPIVVTRNCLSPVVHPAGDGFEIMYTSDGNHYRVMASNDFRRFTTGERVEDVQQLVGDLQIEDLIELDGKKFAGQIFELKEQELAHINQFFAERAADGRKSSERMHDDAKHPLMP